MLNFYLGIHNNDTMLANLQAANPHRRDAVIRELYSMPSLVKKFYSYSNWKAIQALDDCALIIKTLATFEQILEKRDSNLNAFGVVGQNQTPAQIQQICTRSIKKLSEYTISAIALKKEFNRIKNELDTNFKNSSKLQFDQFFK